MQKLVSQVVGSLFGARMYLSGMTDMTKVQSWMYVFRDRRCGTAGQPLRTSISGMSMDIRPVTDTYAVSPQIAAEDVPAIATAGFTHVICNRPDAEVPPALQADAIGAAVEAAGLTFAVLPLTHETLTPENAAVQRDFGAEGKVLAYCASGTRCTMIWAIGQAADRPAHDIVEQARNAGYDIGAIMPLLTAIGQN